MADREGAPIPVKDTISLGRGHTCLTRWLPMIRKTVLDQRGGRQPRWVLLPEGVERLMQVPDQMREAVAFVYCTVNGVLEPKGTALFAGYSIPGYEESDNRVPMYLTAQHVIEAIRRRSDDRKVVLRINARNGAALLFESSVDDWWFGDSSVDCAVLPWEPPAETGAGQLGWGLSSSATDEVIRQEGIGIGDEIFMIGLFRNHLGRDRNEPIVRVGNIAAMPVDPLRSADFGEMRAILIEARSIGGLSGSPVFVHMGFTRWRGDHVATAQEGWPYVFLGLMHGHWEALETEVDAVSDTTGETINTGVGVVVPAQQIMDCIEPLMGPVANKAAERLREADEPVLDSAAETGGESDSN